MVTRSFLRDAPIAATAIALLAGAVALAGASGSGPRSRPPGGSVSTGSPASGRASSDRRWARRAAPDRA